MKTSLTIAMKLKFMLEENMNGNEVEVALRLPVSQYVLVSGTPLGPMTRFFFFLSFSGKLFSSSSWGALSDERTGL
jgi:hypothetical protein